MRVNLDRIKVLADEKGWSQAELARKMHLSRAYISRLFSGERIGGRTAKSNWEPKISRESK